MDGGRQNGRFGGYGPCREGEHETADMSGNEETFTVRIWGARGSIPVSGPDIGLVYGSDTCCVEMEVAGRHLVFDAGSGIVRLGKALKNADVRECDLFLSHAHYDHIMGLPFFVPFYLPDRKVRVWAGHMLDGQSCEEIVTAFMRTPFLPMTPKVFRAEVDYRTFAPRDVLEPAPGIRIRTAPLNHPNGAVGYRVEYGNRTVSYITDTEHDPERMDDSVLALMDGADLVFYDTAYTDAELTAFRGFGHSTWQEGIRLCRAAGARRLVLFHHWQHRTDAELAAIEAEARAAFPGTTAGRPGLEFVFPVGDVEARPGEVADVLR